MRNKLFVCLTAILVIGARTAHAENAMQEVRRLHNRVIGIRNTWDADREGMRLRIEFVNPAIISDPPATVDMVGADAVFEVLRDGRFCSEWSKRMLDSLANSKWMETTPAAYFGYVMTVEGPWNSVLLRIGISTDHSRWYVGGIWIKASAEMRAWEENALKSLTVCLQDQLQDKRSLIPRRLNIR